MPTSVPLLVRARVILRLLVVSAALLAATATGLGSAQAAAGDVGYAGPAYTSNAGSAPTAEKPESKLWWTEDGLWWASMFHAPSLEWRPAYLDRTANPPTWVFTATELDDRASSRADTLWAGGKLYVASHKPAANSSTYTTGSGARLYRYSYSTATRSYTLDPGFPAQINNVTSETLVLDRDSSGRLWVTWTQDQSVYVNATTTAGNDASWGTPFVLPVEGATGIGADDISTLVSFKGNLGVMWSDQVTHAVRFAFRPATAGTQSWSPSARITVPGVGQADDHLNIKSIESDGSGRVFAVIKTNLDAEGPSAPSIVVLARDTQGGWSRATFGTVADCHTRPMLLVDSTNQLLHVYATAPDTGCTYSGATGSIFKKTSPLGQLSFASGRGSVVMRNAASPNLNNVTGSKQTVNANTGIVLLASDDSAQRYWFSDESLGTTPPPTTPPPTTPPPTTPPPPPPSGETVTVTPVADAHVDRDSTSRNFGRSTKLEVDADPIRQGFVKFDLGAYAGRTVESATLQIRVSTSGSKGSQRIKHVANDGWTELGVTWNNRPALGAQIGTLGASRTSTTYDVPLTASAVQGDLGGVLSLGIDSSSSDGLDIASRETSTPMKLVVKLAPASTQQPTGPSPEPTQPSGSATQTVRLTAVADSFAEQANPSRTFGTLAVQEVDSAPGKASYLKFDLSAYAGRAIQSATLQVSVSSSGSKGSQRVKHVSDDSWTESGLSWNTKPAAGASLGTFGNTTVNQTYDVPLSLDTVQLELGTLLSLAVDSDSTDGVDLATRESGTPTRLVLVLAT